MARNPRYDVLFEPVRLGPVTAPNRFYQVSPASGMTNALPRGRAAFRETKAEGGWGVVCTGACSIHPSSDDAPLPFARLWDEDDVRSHALTTEAVHRHGALAAIELVHNGPSCSNLYSREVPIGPAHQPVNAYHPVQARAMDRDDIRAYRGWHRAAALRARRAGLDIVYVNAGHAL